MNTTATEPRTLEEAYAKLAAEIADGAYTAEYDMLTADQWRDRMKRNYKEAADSFDRCDTDGFMSQWASNITGDEYRLKAELAETAGFATFVALFTTEGELVPAHMVDTQWGTSWRIFDTRQDGFPTVGWFRESAAQNPATAAKNNAKKGYRIGSLITKARVGMSRGNLCTVRPIIYPQDKYMVNDVYWAGIAE